MLNTSEPGVTADQLDCTCYVLYARQCDKRLEAFGFVFINVIMFRITTFTYVVMMLIL